MGSSPPAQDRPRGPQERSQERPAPRAPGRPPSRAPEPTTEPTTDRHSGAGDGLDDHDGDGSGHLVTARAEGEQATVEILIPLCRQTEYEVAKAALWQWRTRWRREITYSFKSNLRRRVDAGPGTGGQPTPGRPPRREAEEASEGSGGGIEYAPTVWVIKASLRAIADLPREYPRRIIPDLVPRWGVIACVRDQYTDNGRGERQYGTKHFAVGAEVYAHPPLSRMRGGRGDAPPAPGPYDRALFTGLHRQTKRFVTVMQPTLRFEDWRVGEISHPVVLHEFRTNGVWNFDGALEEARRIANQMNERIFHLKIDRTPTE